MLCSKVMVSFAYLWYPTMVLERHSTQFSMAEHSKGPRKANNRLNAACNTTWLRQLSYKSLLCVVPKPLVPQFKHKSLRCQRNRASDRHTHTDRHTNQVTLAEHACRGLLWVCQCHLFMICTWGMSGFHAEGWARCDFIPFLFLSP